MPGPVLGATALQERAEALRAAAGLVPVAARRPQARVRPATVAQMVEEAVGVEATPVGEHVGAGAIQVVAVVAVAEGGVAVAEEVEAVP
ncbi:hypothetical protein RJ55_01755 [Drechmeria coniospora]|nr:hypothetical protein RJ55_01755 [Drechmeria coniospora]